MEVRSISVANFPLANIFKVMHYDCMKGLLGHHNDCGPSDLGQYNGLDEYSDPHTASSLFIIILLIYMIISMLKLGPSIYVRD